MKRSFYLAARGMGLLALASLAACTRYEIAVREPVAPAPPAPQTARVCVLRPQRVAALAPAVVRDNGQLVGMTRGRSRFCYLVQPGDHQIASTYGDDIDARLGLTRVTDATLSAVSGETYFLQHDVGKLLTLEVRWVTPEAAGPMLTDTPEVELVTAPDGEPLPRPSEVIPARPAAPQVGTPGG